MRRFAGVGTCVLAVALVPAAQSPVAQTPVAQSPVAQTPVAQSPGPSVVTITGLGFGHGRGMGQWGAYGYATLYGWGYKQILAHYYGGTVLGHLAAEPDITVDIGEFGARQAQVAALPGGTLTATWPGGPQFSAPAFAVASTPGTTTLYSGAGCAGPWRPLASTAAPLSIASSTDLGLSKVDACLPSVGQRIYQGEMVARPGGGIDNVLPLEAYVAGVVPVESPADWAGSGGEAALEAQAVAARSYALAFVARGAAICDDTACQMYSGWPDQYGLTADNAVQATSGEVLYCAAGSNCGPAGSVALTEYSASTGGYTAGGAFPAVPDLGDPVPANPVHTWSVAIPVGRLEALFPSIGSFVQLEVTSRNGLGQMGGRVGTVLVKGTAGTATVTGGRLAAELGLRSDWFAISGAPLVAPTGTTTTSTAPGTPTTRPQSSAPPTTTRPPSSAPPTTTRPPSSAPTTTTTPRTVTTTTSPAVTTTSLAVATTTVPPTTVATGTTRPGSTGTTPGAQTTTTGPGLVPGTGVWVTTSAGDVAALGAAPSYGTALGTSLAGEVVALVATPDERGYWLAGRDGAVLALGDARWRGSATGPKLTAAIVSMAPTPDGRGYWLVSRNGGVFAFGDAHFYGAVGSAPLSAPIVSMAPTPDGRGYWLVSRNGGVFAYGDARFYGSTAEERVPVPISGLVATGDGRGYVLVGADGQTYGFGDAHPPVSPTAVAGQVAAVAPANRSRGCMVATTAGEVYTLSLDGDVGPLAGDVWPPSGGVGALTLPVLPGGPVVGIAFYHQGRA